MLTSNTIVMNTNAGYNTQIVLDAQYEIDDVVALLAIDGEMKLMTAFPMSDPSDWLLPRSIMDAGVELAENSDGRIKMWDAGVLTERDGKLFIDTRCVGTVDELFTLSTLVKNLM